MSEARAYLRRVQCRTCGKPVRVFEAVQLTDGYYHADCLRKALGEHEPPHPNVQFRFF
jgi:hypothetical protein